MNFWQLVFVAMCVFAVDDGWKKYQAQAAKSRAELAKLIAQELAALEGARTRSV
jgi:hypothetical protein